MYLWKERKLSIKEKWKLNIFWENQNFPSQRPSLFSKTFKILSKR